MPSPSRCWLRRACARPAARSRWRPRPAASARPRSPPAVACACRARNSSSRRPTAASTAPRSPRCAPPRALAGLDADELPGDALNIDPRAAEFLGAFYAFADAQLQSLRADAEDPSPIHLWPEHFDLAFDAGDEAAGQRATYGASPGDEKHPEPYLYVGPWRTPAPSEIWNAHGFTGAELAWAELVIDADPRAAALDFWRAARAALAS